MAKLILITAGGVKLIKLSSETVTLGRSEKCDVVIDQPLISRLHATLSSAGSVFSICDLDSRNGTFVNGVKVHRHTLAHRDVIRFGDCEVRYLEAPSNNQSTDLLDLVA